MGLSKKEEREHARILYVNERITLKEIAGRLKVTEKTVGKWAKDGNWDELRKSLLNTRQSQLIHFYNQLEAINIDIAERPPLFTKDSKGKLIEVQRPQKNIPTNGESDILSKITSNIQKLETEIGLGELVETGKKIIAFIQQINLDDARLFKNYFDEYIQNRVKNG
ncbi:hypothetical protein FO675_06200 [Riemerella anatipestifer]|uniref:hypothetical protein n=1 Tax=Riemerella anatipestifer TaxID=34085 RepID=UPI001AD740A6|nr:hypothetical protein [Riemerella anatipestifer]MBO4233894.1 hypothetical protein [Riemerella anatipestifer]